jgi:hypothetical protein
MKKECGFLCNICKQNGAWLQYKDKLGTHFLCLPCWDMFNDAKPIDKEMRDSMEKTGYCVYK